MNIKKLAIGLPTMGLHDWRFTSSLMGLQLPAETRVIWLPRVMIDAARNRIVTDTLKDPSYTHLLMIDDDMTFSSDFALKLLEHDVDIVGGLAFKRRPDYEPCVYRQDPDNKKYFPILPEVFQEVAVVGSGGILIKTEIFKHIPYPWFETYYDDDENHWSVDFDFCIKARKAGFKIFVDPDADMGHIGDSNVVTKDIFLQHVNRNNKTVEDKNIK